MMYTMPVESKNMYNDQYNLSRCKPYHAFSSPSVCVTFCIFMLNAFAHVYFEKYYLPVRTYNCKN